MDAAEAGILVPHEETVRAGRLLNITAIAVLLGIAGGVIARILLTLISLITNLVFTGQISAAEAAVVPESGSLWLVIAPVGGALVIGLMARFGSPAIRGHGIPEVMEKVLHGESRIPTRLLFLKPLSAAIAIGTGGPFGAEGPIIATGGAMGSVVGQAIRITADERKTLLAAGAAAGMAATFGTPVSAVLLAIELLLFEFRARSIIPVAMAAAAATSVRFILIGREPMFAMPSISEPSWQAMVAYVLIGAIIGLLAVGITRVVYLIEDSFERLPVHWMWWPAIGAVAVGVCGYIDPRILGVGYRHIEEILSGGVVGWSLVALVVLKFVAWSIYLGSGTSGGTLAPLFIIGGGVGAGLGAVAAALSPAIGISIPIAALVGMAAVFAGASHALLASIVFAFEATRQPLGLLPLLAGCSAAYLISVALMRTSIMTERLARRGSLVRPEYSIDHLSQVLVRDAMSTEVVALPADGTLRQVRDGLLSRSSAGGHHGFPVVSDSEELVGVLTRGDLLAPDLDPDTPLRRLVPRAPVVALPHNSLRQAADHMVREKVGRLPVVDPSSGKLVGIITRSDLLSAHASRLRARDRAERSFKPDDWW